jgi:hypothetical protein
LLVHASAFLALCLAPAATATAQTADYPPDEGGLEVSRTFVPAGGTLEIAASGFCPGRDVEVFLVPSTDTDSAPAGAQPRTHLGSAPVDGQGDVSQTVTIPATVAPGEYELSVRGLRSDCSTVKTVSSKIEVPGGRQTGGSGDSASPARDSSTGLAFTGLELALLFGTGSALLVGGLVVRRRAAEGTP